MFGVLGSGYGLYGYVPSIMMNDGSVCLLEKTKELCRQRIETKNFVEKITWAEHKDELCNIATSLVIAQPPQEQYNIVQELFQRNNTFSIKRMVLEKPLAANPQQAQELIKLLIENSIQVRVGYIFLYSEWLKSLTEAITNKTHIQINLEWLFQAHHIVHNKETWKKYHSLGGGCLRFYAIHIIAVLAHLNFTSIDASELYYIADDVPVKWVAKFCDAKANIMQVRVDICADTKTFILHAMEDNVNVLSKQYADVFAMQETKYHDVRSNYIDELLKSFNASDTELYNWYVKTNILWADIEDKTQNIRMQL